MTKKHTLITYLFTLFIFLTNKSYSQHADFAVAQNQNKNESLSINNKDTIKADQHTDNSHKQESSLILTLKKIFNSKKQKDTTANPKRGTPTNGISLS